MGTDDTVEYVEGHRNDEVCTAKCRCEKDCVCQHTEPILIGRHGNIVSHVQIQTKTCKQNHSDVSRK